MEKERRREGRRDKRRKEREGEKGGRGKERRRKGCGGREKRKKFRREGDSLHGAEAQMVWRREDVLPPFLLLLQLVLERDQWTEMIQMLLKLYGYWTWNEIVLMTKNQESWIQNEKGLLRRTVQLDETSRKQNLCFNYVPRNELISSQ